MGPVPHLSPLKNDSILGELCGTGVQVIQGKHDYQRENQKEKLKYCNSKKINEFWTWFKRLERVKVEKKICLCYPKTQMEKIKFKCETKHCKLSPWIFKPSNSQEKRGQLLWINSKEIQQILQNLSLCLDECPMVLCYTPQENPGQCNCRCFQVSDFIIFPFCEVVANW